MSADTAPRASRCPSCKIEVPSRPDLPFFQDRSAGTDAAENHCAHCGYHRIAHDPERMRSTVRGQTVIEDGRCPGPEFAPRGAFATDLHYCGCRGWD